MTNFELIKALLKRLKKFSWLVIILGLGLGTFFYFIAKKSLSVSTSKFTVFPLSSSSDNSMTNSMISNILGLSDAPKSFSGEASINIVELALSRRIREVVALERLPEFNNKTVAEMLIVENNRHLGFMQNQEMKIPRDSIGLVNATSGILRGGFQAKINKNGILEMNYSSSDVNLVRQISNIYVNKISMFYVELKKKKAQIDFDFAEQKVDSLFKVMSVLDKQLIQMNETHFFTNDELMRFSIPKLNLQQYKSAIQSQYYYAVNNREAAAYKLQKETPIIETLDKPEPPYDESKKSGVMYAFIGFILGVFIGILLVSWKIISNYMEQEVNKLIEKAEQKSKEKSSQTIETRVETQVTQ